LLTGRCDKSYFNQHIEVIDLRSKATWTIGAGLTVCHSLSSLSWTPDGRHLAFAYGRSELRPGDHANAGMGAGMCQVPAPPVLDVVAAFTSQSGVGGRTGTAEPGCQIGALTATASGYAAIEGCGGHDGIGRYGRFITYSPALAVLSHSDIGRCINGAEIRTNTTGTAVLGSTYQYCNPPGTTPPHTVTFVADQRGLRTIYDQPNGGMNKFRAISW
jgi:hypothetical protein